MTGELENGVSYRIEDQSVRYFGDYHHVRLVVTFSFPCDERVLPSGESLPDVRRSLGETITFRRILSRMGVPSSDLDRTRQELIDSFFSSSIPYLSRPDFPSRKVKGMLDDLKRFGAVA